MNPQFQYLASALVALLFLAGCNINVNDSNSQYEYSESFNFNVPVAQYDNITISNVNGSINVVGVDGLSEVKISGQKTVQDDSRDEAKSHIGDIYIDILTQGNSLTIRTTQPNSSGRRNYQVDYNIQVPIRWDLSVANVNGTVVIGNIQSAVNVTLTNGTLNASDIVGDLDATLANGNIDADVTLLSGNKCDLNTSNGNVVLSIPNSTSASVSASVVNGSVTVAVPAITVSSSSRTHFVGTMGKGESTISLSTVNGNVQLKSY